MDDARSVVYGPNFGRLYLVTRGQTDDGPLLRILGLPRNAFRETLADPATGIAHDLTSLKASTPVEVPFRLRLAYRLLHRSRRVLPFRAVVGWVAAAAAALRRFARHDRLDAREIGRLLHAVERATGIADCYPRALLTAFLALRCGRHCELTIGALVPTRKMHAWCSVEGELPYEPMPEHYMYSPLLVLALSS